MKARLGVLLLSLLAKVSTAEEYLRGERKLLNFGNRSVGFEPMPVGNTGATTGRFASLFEGDIMITMEEALEGYGQELVDNLVAAGFVFLDLSDSGIEPPMRRDLAARLDHRWPVSAENASAVLF